MNIKLILILLLATVVAACVSHPPSNINNVCHIFKQYPKWARDTQDVARRWKVPVPVQMAIMHQESKFESHAKPPRQKVLWVIPWKRPSSAEGYAQALRATWSQYKKSDGWIWSSRHDFGDGADFIGWYANQAHRKAGIPRTDAYKLYLAYHEGIGGYQRKTYLKKPWLMSVARKVNARAALYRMQLNACRVSSKRHAWF
jgi:hypothetical protein